MLRCAREQTNPCGKYTVAGDVVELPQFIPQRSPVHIARLVNPVGHYTKTREQVDGQDGLSIIGDAVTHGSEILYIAKGGVAGRIIVVRGEPLMLHLFKPVRLILCCVPVAKRRRTLRTEGYNTG